MHTNPSVGTGFQKGMNPVTSPSTTLMSKWPFAAWRKEREEKGIQTANSPSQDRKGEPISLYAMLDYTEAYI